MANLLANVRSHTPSGTTTVVTVAPSGGGTVVVDVADDGPGIAAGDRDHVFDRFFRSVDARRRTADGVTSGGGSGLGLAIV